MRGEIIFSKTFKANTACVKMLGGSCVTELKFKSRKC